MNLLFSNDGRGAYPDSWYAATSDFLPEQPKLQGETRADVCVIGAGYTGLSTALHLAEKGYDVALLDAQRIGFGASGRNGGQLGSGQRVDQEGLVKMLGAQNARPFWQMGEDAKALVLKLIDTHGMECMVKPGVAELGNRPDHAAELQDYARFLQETYDYEEAVPLTAQELEEICPSPAYHGGMLDRGAAHLHPLRFALGLGRAALAAGVRIYEQSHVHHIKNGAQPVVQTDQGRVIADQVVLAGNGYLGRLNRKVAARVMPINNFIVATEPLGDAAKRVLAQDVAVADSKFVINYFRLSHDGRLLFGGGESYGYRFPDDIAAIVRRPMTEIFPHLSDVRIDYAWGGTLAITMKRLPYMARPEQNIWSASGYSGHGLGNATQAGLFLAEAIHGRSNGFDLFADLPAPRFPGAGMMRTPLLKLAMHWFSMRDKLGL